MPWRIGRGFDTDYNLLFWKNWREVLIIVKPETVIKWHRQGFKPYWRWKSKAPLRRPKIDKEIPELIKRMSLENPLWGTPRIQSELRLLGYDLAESTVAKYRIRGGASSSQTWKTFLADHAKQIAAIDFGAVPTLTFRNLYCFIILPHDRRQVIHFNVTAHPTGFSGGTGNLSIADRVNVIPGRVAVT